MTAPNKAARNWWHYLGFAFIAALVVGGLAILAVSLFTMLAFANFGSNK
jgi:hypothetical protein